MRLITRKGRDPYRRSLEVTLSKTLVNACISFNNILYET